jgi:hypothetical protein
MLELFAFLLFAHFVMDFCMQSEFMSKYKGKLQFVMFVHVFVWTFAVCWMVTFFTSLSLWIPIFLFVGHGVADSCKIKLIEKEGLTDENDPDVLARLKFLFHVDQVWHLVQLTVVTLFA